MVARSKGTRASHSFVRDELCDMPCVVLVIIGEHGGLSESVTVTVPGRILAGGVVIWLFAFARGCVPRSFCVARVLRLTDRRPSVQLLNSENRATHVRFLGSTNSGFAFVCRGTVLGDRNHSARAGRGAK